MFGNGAQLAHLTGYTRARISQFEKGGTLKRGKNRLFDLEKSAEAIGRPIQLTDEQKADSGPIDFAEWRNLKMKEDALISQTERPVLFDCYALNF